MTLPAIAYDNKIKVSTHIREISKLPKIAPKLVIGNEYYISFVEKECYKCKLLEVYDNYERTTVNVGVWLKKKYQVDNEYAVHTVYANEIGLTPENAIRNQFKLPGES